MKDSRTAVHADAARGSIGAARNAAGNAVGFDLPSTSAPEGESDNLDLP
ncbi:hypothetical protein [Sphingomonas faeni]